MSLVPRDSWFDFSHMFDHNFPTLRHRLAADVYSPRINIVEQEKNFEITADLPGVNKSDISVQLSNGSLTIEAVTKKDDQEEKDGKVIRKERYEGRLLRSFYLGHNIQQEDVQAHFTDGVLTIVVPKLEGTSSDSTNIEIN